MIRIILENLSEAQCDDTHFAHPISSALFIARALIKTETTQHAEQKEPISLSISIGGGFLSKRYELLLYFRNDHDNYNHKRVHIPEVHSFFLPGLSQNPGTELLMALQP